MADNKYLLEQAKKAASNAIKAERQGAYSQAFDFYLRAAEILNKILTIERNQNIRDSYYAKAKEYISRAKELKIVMEAQKSKADLKKDLPPAPAALDKSPQKPPQPSSSDSSSPPSVETQTTPKEQQIPPSSSETSKEPKDVTSDLMRGRSPPSAKAKSPPKDLREQQKKDPKKEVKASKKPEDKPDNIPTKTTFEILYEKGHYQECIIECAKSVETELRVRLGNFDEKVTLGMLINNGLEKGFTSLKSFKFVNILINRIEHENYEPSQTEAAKAVEITNSILMS
ncbi:MAG: hypothetical protein U9O98_09790 [Asgard group archaeon]|nr:hypothetical protein [Asgard group archaeon]